MKKIVVIAIIWLTGICSLPAMATEPIKIATIFAKTGIAAVQNASYIQMVELGVEEINNQGGLLGRPVELIVLDNKSTPIGSTQAAKEAVRLSYDAVMVLADAIRRAESLNRVKIRDTLAQTKEFQGATGSITFDEYGDPQGKEVIILKLEKGRQVYYKAIKP